MGGPRHGGGGHIKRKRKFERRFRRTKRRYSEGERQKDVDQVLMINLFFFVFMFHF